MKTANLLPEQVQRDNVAHILRSINTIWWSVIEKRYSDAEFAAYVALAEIQDYIAIKDEQPTLLRLPE